MEQKKIIALMGAGGKLGFRILANLLKTQHTVHALETGEEGMRRVISLGIEPADENVLPKADLTILALPDVALGKLSFSVVPRLKANSTVMMLDPAAPFMKDICMRGDCHYVVVHPCHPALFYAQKTDEARRDLFGGVAGEQNIVAALMQGGEEAYDGAVAVAKEMFAPVIECYRVTVEQRAVLEPAAAEVVIATCACVMKEAIDEAVARGVPEDAAKAFLMGHIQIPLVILFKGTSPFSDAAKKAIAYGREVVFKEDWKKAFEPEFITEALRRMLDR
jgi:hypothetical protein